jgi:hypothetical protein
MALRAARTASLFVALATLLPVSLPASAAGIFCCLDERSKQVCGDVLPPACYGRAYRELGANGMTLREVEAPLTEAQKAQRLAEEKRKKKEEDAAREQHRLDQALLQTYGTVEDIELMRKRAEADVITSIKAAMVKIDEAKQRRKKFEDEAEFYKKRTLPPEVDKGLKDADYEIQAQENLIASKQKEFDIIKAKYDDDKRRYLEVKRNRSRLQ